MHENALPAEQSIPRIADPDHMDDPCEVLSLELEDLRLSEAQLRVRGKAGKVRMMPLPPETIRLLDCYLKTERPMTNAAQLIVSRNGRAQGKAKTKAGLHKPAGLRRGRIEQPVTSTPSNRNAQLPRFLVLKSHYWVPEEKFRSCMSANMRCFNRPTPGSFVPLNGVAVGNLLSTNHFDWTAGIASPLLR